MFVEFENVSILVLIMYNDVMLESSVGMQIMSYGHNIIII